jgi:hypothetical protein
LDNGVKKCTKWFRTGRSTYLATASGLVEDCLVMYVLLRLLLGFLKPFLLEEVFSVILHQAAIVFRIIRDFCYRPESLRIAILP